MPTGGEVAPTPDPAMAPTRTDAGAAAAAIVGRISFCGHPELHGTLCTSCGRSVVPPAANGGRREDSAGGGANGGGGGGGGSTDGDGEGGGGGTHQVLMKGGKMMSVTAEGESDGNMSERQGATRQLSVFLFISL